MKVNEISGENLCIICVERERDCLILPCKHNATCLKCSKSLALCPFCRVKIQETIRIYKNWHLIKYISIYYVIII